VSYSLFVAVVAVVGGREAVLDFSADGGGAGCGGEGIDRPFDLGRGGGGGDAFDIDVGF
jgi:hypothetical protein